MIEEKEKEFACLFLQSDLSKINPENNYQVTGGNLQEHTRTDRAGAAGARRSTVWSSGDISETFCELCPERVVSCKLHPTTCFDRFLKFCYKAENPHSSL